MVSKSQKVFDVVGSNLPPEIYSLIKSLDGSETEQSSEVEALLSALSDNEKRIEELEGENSDLRGQIEYYKDALEGAKAFPEDENEVEF